MASIAFPVYVLAKDDGSVMRFRSLLDMGGYLEVIDVSNDEYAAWDVRGQCLILKAGKSKSDWLMISPTDRFAAEDDFAEICKKASEYSPENPISKLRRGLVRGLGSKAKG